MRRPSRARIWLLGTVLAVVTVGGLGAALVFGFTSNWDRTDVIGGMGIALGIATLFLAGIASVVAVAAYAAATAVPDLEPQIMFPGCEINEPVLINNPSQTSPGVFSMFVSSGGLMWARVRTYNRSAFPGRNPSFRIHLVNLRVQRKQPIVPLASIVSPQGWKVIDGDPTGATAYQWESAGTTSAHGNWATYLPNLNLDGLMAVGTQPPQIVLEVVAEGLTNPVRKTVDIKQIHTAGILRSASRCEGRTPGEPSAFGRSDTRPRLTSKRRR